MSEIHGTATRGWYYLTLSELPKHAHETIDDSAGCLGTIVRNEVVDLGQIPLGPRRNNNLIHGRLVLGCRAELRQEV